MGAWIEISVTFLEDESLLESHPTMGAWIEIANAVGAIVERLCRTPRWVRGLKSQDHSGIVPLFKSHPTMGAWIEILQKAIEELEKGSHPTMGAWIEILHSFQTRQQLQRRTPRWVRGLKSF